ncbi:MAG TPA: FecR family protein [Pyrinomonadaceae bacterium]|nr:FecR family protein [Pyrinomonadaceae bacterium]
MKKARLAIPALFALLVIAFPLIAQSQTRDKFVITARAGGVNAVTGRASMRAHGNSEWQQLMITEDLETGDAVRTGIDGRVEMLLNPGSYMRVGENSEFELTNSSLENLEVRLIRGTAIVEATGADDAEMLINIITPHTRLAIVRRGLYRLTVVPGDATELVVRKGRVMLDNSQTKVKGGNKVVFNSDSFFIAKLKDEDKKKGDGLDSWSKERATTLAEVNNKITGRDRRSILASYNDVWANRLSASSRGFWFYSPRFRCYSFMPFGFGWGSPYGSSYDTAFFPSYYGCYGCGYYGYRNAQRRNVDRDPIGGNTGSTGGTPSAPSPSTPSAPPPQPMSPPPSYTPPINRPALENRVQRHQERLP